MGRYQGGDMKRNLTLVALGLWGLTCLTSYSETRPTPFPTFKKQDTDFFYSQQTSFWIFLSVPKSILQKVVGDTLAALGLEIATFENSDTGYVILKPMAFSSEFGKQSKSQGAGLSTSTEIELTTLVWPKSKGRPSPETFESFVHGKNKNSSVGQLRLDVLCDNEVAVAAGRLFFGEHKYLGTFDYEYPTPNNLQGSAKPFFLNMTAYNWNQLGIEEGMLFKIQTKPQKNFVESVFSPELLYSAFPPEPSEKERQKAVGEFRQYNGHFKYFEADEDSLKIAFGEARGAAPLQPVAPGDGKLIPGSETWPVTLRDRLETFYSHGKVMGFLLFQPEAVEYETKPFFIEKVP